MGLRTALGALFKGTDTLPGGAPLGGDNPYANGTGRLGNAWPLLLPSSRIDYRSEAGDLLQNAIIQACLHWIMRTFPEAPIGVRRAGDDGQNDFVPKHPLTRLLNQPNPYYNGVLLIQALLCSWNLAGNAYILKLRNDKRHGGTVKQLWYEPHDSIRPIWPDDGSEFISGYRLLRRGVWLDAVVPREDVIHFRNGIDPANPRYGMSPLSGIYREVFTDNEAANFAAALLRNMGVPGMVLSPKTDAVTIAPADAEQLKRDIMAKFGGDRRGEPLVMMGPTEVEMVSFSPEQLDLGKMRHIPEERITALLGVPAMLIGLGAGLEASTLSNYEQAERAGYKHNILPTQRLFAAQLETDLLPELGDPETESVAFDTTDVRALAEDQNGLFNRVSLAYAKGVLKRADARRLLGKGLSIDASDNCFLTDLITINARLMEDEPAGTLVSADGLPPGMTKALPHTTESRQGQEMLEQTFNDLMADLLDVQPDQ